MQSFEWTDELVIEYIQIFGTDTTHFDEFKNMIMFIPREILFLQVIKNGEIIDTDNRILKQQLNNGYLVYSLLCHDVKFTIGETLYNEKQKKKDGGKWNSYAVKAESFDVVVKEMCGKIVSTNILLNNFYDLKNFIKR